MLKIYMLLIVLGLLGGVGYGAYYYYKDTQERIQVLTENNAKIMVAKELQDNTINTLIADREKFAALNNELQTKLSLQKPGLVEKKINNGTKKLFKSLEELSGSKPDPVDVPDKRVQ